MVVLETATQVLLYSHFSVDDIALENGHIDADVLEFFVRSQLELQGFGACLHGDVSSVCRTPCSGNSNGA